MGNSRISSLRAPFRVALPVRDDSRRFLQTIGVQFRPEPLTTYLGSLPGNQSIRNLLCRLGDTRQYEIRETSRNAIGSMFHCMPLSAADAPVVTLLTRPDGAVTVCDVSQGRA